MIHFSIIFMVSVLGQSDIFGQASLKINNQSSRQMTVKIMRTYSDFADLHNTVYIPPFSSKSMYFNETGYYFAKTKATLSGKSPIYRKGDPFKVYNGSDGYSVLELTYSIIESSTPEVTGGKEITKTDFESDNY